MDRRQIAGEIPVQNRDVQEEEILAEQVRQIYGLSPFGFIATIINSLIVYFLTSNAMPRGILTAWLLALLTVTLVRIGLVLRYRRVGAGPAAARIWGNRFIAGLFLTGVVWGSIGVFPFSGLSLTHQVFIAFVLGGMAAGAAATFSVMKEGYLAFSVPALAPLAIRFFLIGDVFHYAMGGMLSFYGVFLWRISRRHHLVHRTSLLLRFENREMIEVLQNARAKLLSEIEAKLQAEAELRAHQDHLENVVRERTSDLIRANEQLKIEIEERKQTEKNLRESEERLALAESAGGVGVFDVDLINRRAVWTEQMEELFGLPHGSYQGDYADWARRVHRDDLPKLEAQFQKWMQERRTQAEFEYRCIRADGETRWMKGNARFTYLGDGTPARMIGTNVDITGRKKLEEDIIHLAHHDALTGLPNRLLFNNMMRLELAQARRMRNKLALFFLDLDRFKEINDTFGHDAGDELLKEVSKRLKAAIRESDGAARIGGDEFNILLTDIPRAEDVTIIGQKIIESLRKPVRVAGLELLSTASIGISIYPDDSTEMDTLYRYADIAMYHAKMLGRNNFQFFNSEINMRSVETVRLESMLRQAIDREELVVYYQPQVEIRTRQIVCAEALVRWRHPEMGLLLPMQFIHAAEDSGFITSIDEYVLKSACAQIRAWQDAGLTPVCITVNLSAREFDDPELVTKVARTLQEAGASPRYLDVEITESLAMSNIERTMKRLNEFADMGVHTSIDDFGTGYSSLNYLKRLSIQKLKIDQTFIRDIATEPDDRAIISAVTAMAHKLRMKVIAEGVETEEQLAFLVAAECDEAQGYFFSKALPADELSKLLAKR